MLLIYLPYRNARVHAKTQEAYAVELEQHQDLHELTSTDHGHTELDGLGRSEMS